LGSVVEVEELQHHYGERQALAGLNLQIAEGDFAAILGPNGAGKSTLFRVLSTLSPPQDGTVRVAGNPLPEQAAAVRRQLGVVFQSPGLDGRLSVRENLIHFGWMYGLNGSRLRQRSDSLLEQFGVGDRSADRVETLSGGLQRRVELARALLHEPKILLMDEPTTGLDPDARRILWEHLRGLNEAGVTVIFTTHWFEDADYAGQVAIVDAGKVVASGSPTALKNELSGDVVEVTGSDLAALRSVLVDTFALELEEVGETLRFACSDRGMIGEIMTACGDALTALEIGRPTLADVYVKHTGKELS
jgi:ABC-2 type transport system ATP-binding protein